MTADLALLSTLAVQGAMPALLPLFEQATGNTVAAAYGPTNALVARLRTGEAADLAILTWSSLDELASEGLIIPETLADIAISRVGIAVRAGAPRPDISSVDAFIGTLRSAKSICYSRIGASGVFFAGLVERLGIADEINAKSTIVNGLTAKLAARGEVELAVQQISELRLVPGIDVVGPLPAGVDSVTMFSAGVLARSVRQEAAAALIAHLASATALPALQSAGLDPPR